MINNKICENFMFISLFIIGMFSVSIAKFFGGHYSVVLALMTLLSTILLINSIDKNMIGKNKMNFILLSVLVLCEFVFFVINDVFDYSVYSYNSVKFIGTLVVGSQLYSVGLLVYYWVCLMIGFFQKENVELIDEKNIEEENTEENLNLEIDDVNEEEMVSELKQIPQGNFVKQSPFMEEEK